MSVFRRLRGGGRQSAPSEGYLIVGLGNPGRKYAANRHNVGFQCLDLLAEKHGISVGRKRFQSLTGEGRLDGSRVILLKPQTFMNDSGLAVSPASRWHKIPPERILVIYDDLDLPLGKLRIRQGGSRAGTTASTRSSGSWAATTLCGCASASGGRRAARVIRWTMCWAISTRSSAPSWTRRASWSPRR